MKYIIYLLTAVLPAIKCVAGDTFVFRQSAIQRISASARKAIELLECETSDFTSPDLWFPTALTSIRLITSSGGSCNSGSIRRRSRMWMNSRSNRSLKSGLAYCWSEHYWHCYQRMEKLSACLCLRKGPTFQTFTVSSWTTGQLYKLSARVTDM